MNQNIERRPLLLRGGEVADALARDLSRPGIQMDADRRTTHRAGVALRARSS